MAKSRWKMTRPLFETLPEHAEKSLHLVYDEPMLIMGHWHRVRVWLGKGKVPVVLIDSNYGAPPSSMASRALALECLVKYIAPSFGSGSGFAYFESWKPTGTRSLYLRHVGFQSEGEAGATRFVNPDYRPFDWEVLESMVQEQVTQDPP